METWRRNLKKYFNGELKLFEETYKITSRCRYKKNGKWISARIDMDHGIIYNRNGQVLRRCN